ncbi:MAG: hypothetical protein EPN56_12760 [Rhodanobacter sp.]|nr:MAG: hypothetical protein EPN78_10710 [Rhodanobacter sp.]TAM10401.1 MAG: hypothetical protein EPN66_10180 [Rhodanobacter sp.]TAM34760.1 MAG: hypothetical protein EPN56_12760 [Rhodanobacter sp.]
MKDVKVLVLLVMTMLIGVPITACRRTPDEVQVRAAIAAGAQAVQAGSASDLGAVLTDDFDGNAGELGRRDLVRMVAGLALRGEHVGATTGPIAIERRGDRLVADFTVTLTSGGRVLPDRLGVYRAETAWRREGGHWRCYRAAWKRSL